VVIHRAIFRSIDRFNAILLEPVAGEFPLWLAPEQARVLPINDEVADDARALVVELRAQGIRATVDDRAETLNYKVREAELQKVPYMAVIGAREREAGTVAVRRRGGGRKQEIMERAAWLSSLRARIDARALREPVTD
jgi:threonyl-tRNA synthetase